MDEYYKKKVAFGVFFVVVVVALIPSIALVLLWEFCTSVCCPLIVAVMPGLFYHQILK